MEKLVYEISFEGSRTVLLTKKTAWSKAQRWKNLRYHYGASKESSLSDLPGYAKE